MSSHPTTLSAAVHDLGLLRPKPLPVDANVLIKETVWHLRRGQAPTLSTLVSTGFVKPFVATTVRGEIEEHVAEVVTHQRLDVDTAQTLFREHYLPSIRWVDTGGLTFHDDARIQELARRDPDDLPTARLSLLLGLRAVSEDRDLADYDLATGVEWLKFVFSLKTLSLTEMAGLISLFGANATVEGLVHAVRAARRVPGWVLLLALGGTGVALLNPRVRAQVLTVGGWGGEALSGAGGYASGLLAEHYAATTQHALLQITPDVAAGDAVAEVARLLASTREAVPLEALIDMLPALDPSGIGQALDNPAFIESSGGWELGRRERIAS